MEYLPACRFCQGHSATSALHWFTTVVRYLVWTFLGINILVVTDWREETDLFRAYGEGLARTILTSIGLILTARNAGGRRPELRCSGLFVCGPMRVTLHSLMCLVYDEMCSRYSEYASVRGNISCT